MEWLDHCSHCKLNFAGGDMENLMVVETLFPKGVVLDMQDAS